jgi:hypothetical protein
MICNCDDRVWNEAEIFPWEHCTQKAALCNPVRALLFSELSATSRLAINRSPSQPSNFCNMAKKALAKDQIVKLIVGAGQASPSPPVGPALGSKGVKSMDFCKVALPTRLGLHGF